MIIHPSVLETIGDKIEVSARVDFVSHDSKHTSSKLWFRFPIRCKDQISLDLDPFVVALLLVAMKNKESIEVRGSLSRKLYEGLKEYQKIYHSWYPQKFHLVEVTPVDLREDQPTRQIAHGCAFSGGVDSFYTLIKNKSRITHTVFMAGFDMPLNLKASISELTSSYQTLMSEWGIQFVSGSTNIRKFVNTVDWTNAHGQALVATALFFKNCWNTFYIPSSYRSKSYPKWGTHPSLDPLLSTESLSIIHHGDQANRLNKLQLISQEPKSYSRLRVCWIQDIGLKNCENCEKCIRTRIALKILGALSHYTTFESRSLKHQEIRNQYLRTYQGRLFAQELMWEAFKRGKINIFMNLGYSLLRREIHYRRSLIKKKEKEGTGGAPSSKSML